MYFLVLVGVVVEVVGGVDALSECVARNILQWMLTNL